MSMWKHKETSDHPSLGAWRGTSNFLHGSKSLMRRWFDEHGPGVSSMLCYAKSLQSCTTLCNAIDGSPPGSPVPGILQARTLESVAISFSNAWKWKVKVKPLSRVRPSSDPMDCSLPGSSIHSIFQAGVLEWGAIAFSGVSSIRWFKWLMGYSLMAWQILSVLGMAQLYFWL